MRMKGKVNAVLDAKTLVKDQNNGTLCLKRKSKSNDMVEERKLNYSGVMISKKSTLLKSGSKVAIFFMP